MTRRRVATILVFLSFGELSATVASGAATSKSSFEGSSIAPPRLAVPANLSYPPGARGDATVELLITVEKDGSVAEVIAVAGLEPFRSAAVLAARGLRFVPAERNGAPVKSKIRFRVHFEEPRPIESGGQRPEPSPGSSTAPSAESRSETKPAASEVTVYGTRAAAGSAEFGRAEVRQLPGAFGDPFRAIESLPGVTPSASGVPYFYVRGAPPGNIGYFLDGVRVPYLFHVAVGPSVIHPAMVDRVELFPGSYPAEFGRYAGGIVTASATTPTPSFHGEANLRVFDAGALVEGGFADGKGTALVGGRYSYSGPIVSLFVEGVKLDYRDYQARFTYDLTRDDRLTLFAFGAYDVYGQAGADQNGFPRAGVFDLAFGAEFYRTDLRWEHDLGAGGSVRTDFVLGFDQTRVPDQPRNSRDDMAEVKMIVTEPVSKNTTIRGGTQVTMDAFAVDPRPYADPNDPTTRTFNSLFPPRTDLAVGAWTDLVFKSDVAEVTPGVRVDVYDSGGASAVGVDPRISSRLRVAPRAHIIHTLGLVHQPPSFTIPLPGLAVGSLASGLQTGIQSSAGLEVELPAETTATLTVADNVFLGMTDTLGVSAREQDLADAVFRDLREPRSLGSWVGAEVSVRRKLTQHLGGSLSYTLSRSTRSVGAEHFFSSFDRTHVVSAAVAYDLGRRWRAGARVVAYTGTPSIPASNGLRAPPRLASPPRDPTFYRIDFRLEKKWALSKTAWLSFVIEVMNATLNKEVILSHVTGPVTIPSVGLEAGF